VVSLVIEAPLAEDDVSAGVLDLLDHVNEVVRFHLLELLVVLNGLDLDTVLGLGLWGLEGAGEDHDLGVLDLLLHGGMGEVLVNDDTLNELGVLDGTTGLHDDLDQIEVHVLAVNVGNVEHGLDSKISKVVLALADDLGAESSGGALAEVSEVVLLDVNLLGDFVDFLYRNFTSLLKTISNFKRVNAFIEKLLGLF